MSSFVEEHADFRSQCILEERSAVHLHIAQLKLCWIDDMLVDLYFYRITDCRVSPAYW